MNPICNVLNNRSCKEIMDVFVFIYSTHLLGLKGYVKNGHEKSRDMV